MARSPAASHVQPPTARSRARCPRTDSPIIEADADAVESVTRSEPAGKECTSTPPIRGPPVPPAVYTIASFCAAHHISEAFYFKLKSQDLGPREMRLGTRVFVTFEAAAAWRAEREAATAAAGEAAE